MQRKQLLPCLTATALFACSPNGELLNSDRIEKRFGNYGIEIIAQSANVRRSNLYSTSNGERICRTYAVVQFTDTGSEQIAALHRAVLDGASIGETFATAGWHIDKETVHIGEVDVDSAQHPLLGLMRLSAPESLGLHTYRLSLSNGADKIHYATITEAHHPDYVDVSELRRIYSAAQPPSLTATDVAKLKRLILSFDQ